MAERLIRALTACLSTAADQALTRDLVHKPHEVLFGIPMEQQQAPQPAQVDMAAIRRLVDKRVNKAIEAFVNGDTIKLLAEGVDEAQAEITESIRPQVQRLAKQLDGLQNRIPDASPSTFTRVQLDLAATVAGGGERDISLVRSMVLLLCTYLEVGSAEHDSAMQALAALRNSKISRLTREGLFSIIKPLLVDQEAVNVFESAVELARNDPDEERNEATFKFQTYRQVAISRKTKGELEAAKASKRRSDSPHDARPGKRDREADSPDRRTKAKKSTKSSKKNRSFADILDPRVIEDDRKREQRSYDTDSDEERMKKRTAKTWNKRQGTIFDKIKQRQQAAKPKVVSDSEQEDLHIDTDRQSDEGDSSQEE